MKRLLYYLILAAAVGGCAQTPGGPGEAPPPVDDDGCTYVYELPDVQAQKAEPMVVRRIRRVCGAEAGKTTQPAQPDQK